jgi:glycosyltransferase involved in cell wall biosynthesis
MPQNEEANVVQAVHSALAGPPCEVIVVDGGSTDATAARAAQAGAQARTALACGNWDLPRALLAVEPRPPAEPPASQLRTTGRHPRWYALAVAGGCR